MRIGVETVITGAVELELLSMSNLKSLDLTNSLRGAGSGPQLVLRMAFNISLSNTK